MQLHDYDIIKLLCYQPRRLVQWVEQQLVCLPVWYCDCGSESISFDLSVVIRYFDVLML